MEDRDEVDCQMIEWLFPELLQQVFVQLSRLRVDWQGKELQDLAEFLKLVFFYLLPDVVDIR